MHKISGKAPQRLPNHVTEKQIDENVKVRKITSKVIG